jgi:hypothetical protein
VRRTSRIATALVATATLYGACFLLDAQPERHTTWLSYVGLAFVAGTLLLGLELASAVVTRHDRTTDPLPQRLLRLSGLLALTAVAFGVCWLIARHM